MRLSRLLIVIIGILSAANAQAWPCVTSYTTLSQDVTSMNVQCLPPVHRNAVTLNCGVYLQTTPYTCGPAAVMTLMHCFGMLSSRDMNARTEMRIAAEMGAIPGEQGGTTLSQVSDWLEAHGFSVEEGQHITTDRIIANIRQGIPTLIEFSRHWMLAKGYNPGNTPQNDEIIFSDSSHNINIIKRDVIDSMWAESMLSPSSRFMSPGRYIVAVPKH